MYRTIIAGAFDNNRKMTEEEIAGFNGPQIYVIREGDGVMSNAAHRFVGGSRKSLSLGN